MAKNKCRCLSNIFIAAMLSVLAASALSSSQEAFARDMVLEEKVIVATLRANHYDKKLARLGIRFTAVTGLSTYFPAVGKEPAVIVVGYDDPTPSRYFDMLPGTILRSINGVKINDVDAVVEEIAKHKPGDQIAMKVLALASSTDELIALLQTLHDGPADNGLAAYLLGKVYYHGNFSVSRDFRQAAQWFQKSALNGHVKAMLTLGFLYEYAQGVDENYELAQKWYRNALAKGNTNAIYRLAEVYDKGKGTSVKPETAALHLLHAFRAGDDDARQWLFEYPYHWTKGTRLALQRMLASIGAFEGEIDGLIGSDTQNALTLLKERKLKLPDLSTGSATEIIDVD